ncbi:TetR family transcriptional regulator C-terminal domain-containing protein [Halocynthiibacter styelae]|uniref:TetR family transcriptional regulator C-terminal domain-containing protein n=1 Tax=Halocynthiibacter styelae TaxID=2761955 RepID=A0A8J7J4G4_9RHOB|nr:TetR family transcriptional regulator C-terminal domain-containing protein [Paenihalocynthiibacter styelae]MBI1493140.1 TetR family transcriptional regulator C-terminal domain-containing protein [Paenihalocynthiibacter styelae]
MTKSADKNGKTRIQREKRKQILEAALDVFSQFGYRGSTIDQIAKAAGLSKPNLLYYFPSKDAIHAELLSGLMDSWLDPMRALNADGDPKEEILSYVRRKLQMSRDFPRESRLFANEIIQGAPRILPAIEGELRDLVAEKSAIIQGWINTGRIAPLDPQHLLFSIWSLTQHYADFEVQVRAIMPSEERVYPRAEEHLETLFTRMLSV